MTPSARVTCVRYQGTAVLLSPECLTAVVPCAQMSGPLTAAGETAVLTLLQGLLPPIFFGFGPQWTRVGAVSSDAAAGTTNVTLLLDTFLPVIGNDTSDTFPEVTRRRASARP